MKRIAASLILALVLSIIIAPVTFAAVTLPDYEKEVASETATCDNGATSLALYKTEAYMLTVAIQYYSKSLRIKHAFYILINDAGEHFFYKALDPAETKELSHEAWDVNLKEYAPNSYHFLHNSGPTDCEVAE